MENARGFTVLELIMTLLLLAILSSVSLPGLREFIAQQRSDSVIRNLNNAITLARTAAVTTGKVVTMCRSADGTSCGGNWEDGILVFTDENADRKLNQDDSLRHYFSFPQANGSLRWRAFQNRQYLQFSSLGFTRTQNGNFTYCDASRKPELARQLIVNRSARVRIALDSDGDGIREDSAGKPIMCNN